MSTQVQVTIDCADPDRLARFWAEALGYRMPDPPGGHATWEEALAAFGVPKDQWNSASALEDPDGKGPRMYFQQVPESKVAKNRMHLDLNIGGGNDVPVEERRARVDAGVARLKALGATDERGAISKSSEFEPGAYWVRMNDPEGNEFCVQ